MMTQTEKRASYTNAAFINFDEGWVIMDGATLHFTETYKIE